MIENINLNGSTVSAELHGYMYNYLYGYNGIFGDGVKATIKSNNQIELSSGLIINQGRFMRIKGSETVTIQNGTSGVNRTDLIVSRLTKTGTDETHTLFVYKGTSEAIPSYAQHDTYDGGWPLNDVPLYTVHLNGVNIDKVERFLPQIYSANDLIQKKISNENLLINPNFYINQRGSTTYDYSNDSSQHYTVDRWKATCLKVVQIANGISLSAPTAGGNLTQKLEETPLGDCTMSFEITSISGTCQCILTSSTNTTKAITFSKVGIYELTHENVNKVQFYLTKGSSCSILWTKLEEGKIRTNYIVPKLSLEYIKCRRYYYQLGQSLIGYCSGGSSSMGNNFYFYDANLKNMRTEGTAVVVGNATGDYIRYEGSGQVINIVDKGITLFNSYIRIQFVNDYVANRNSRIIALDLTTKIYVDAEIY